MYCSIWLAEIASVIYRFWLGDDGFCRILKGGIERDLLASSVESLSAVYAKKERVLFLQRDNILTKFGVQKPPKLPLRKTPGEFWQLAQVD